MLQFVLEFATTKPGSVSPAEDPRPNSSSPTPCSQPPSENDVPVDNRLDTFCGLWEVTASRFTRKLSLNLPLVLSSHWFCSFALDSKPEDADSSEGLVSSCQRTPIHKPFTQCRPPVDCSPQPAPHNISDEELHSLKTCLQRWRTEVENDISGDPDSSSLKF